LADRIYCTRENRKRTKELGIDLIAKPLGRPPKIPIKQKLKPGERNPIEGKFGQAKTKYGMDRIKARLKSTSESWIATIILVLNLVKLTSPDIFGFILNMIKMEKIRSRLIINENQRKLFTPQTPIWKFGF